VTTQGTQGQDDNQQGDQQAQTPAERTFTQADLNRIAAQARTEERAKYGDYDDLKASKAKLDDIEKANQSEADRLRAEAEASKATASKAQSALTEAIIGAEVRVQALQKGAVDADTVLAVINRTGISFADGKVVGVAEAIDALLESKPFLKAQQRPGAPNPNPGKGEAPVSKLSQDAQDAAKLLGLTDEELAKGLAT
jgi:hypothetical protein